MPELDYASIISAGQGLVPNLRQQMMQDEQMRMQREQRQLALADAQTKQARQNLFRGKLGAASASGDPRAIAQLMIEFPEFAEQLKTGASALSEEARTRNLTQGGSIYARANSGDLPGAATLLEQRYNADLAAGHADPEDKEILDGLRSDDPIKRKAAVATMGIHLAAIAGPDKFAEIYGKLNPAEKTSPVMREYEDRVGRFGKQAADQWLAVQDTKLIPVQAGGSVYNAADLVPGGSPAPTQPKGGDQPAAAPVAGFTMPVTGGTFTSGFGASRDGGSRRHNGLDIAAPAGSPVTPIAPGTVVKVGSDGRSGLFVKVRHSDGRVSSYAHLAQQSVKQGDAVGPGTRLGTVGTSGNATGPVVHLVIRDKNGQAVDPRPLLGHGPVTVRSVQEANKLPKGTHYRNPEGREFVR